MRAIGLLATLPLVTASCSSPSPDAVAGRDAVVTIAGPTVIAFYRPPESDSVLEADVVFATALDDQQYYGAESRERLAAYGVTYLSQPGLRLIVRDDRGDRLFAADPDSSYLGYLIVAPGRDVRVVYRVQYPDDLISRAAEYFELRTLEAE